MHGYSFETVHCFRPPPAHQIHIQEYSKTHKEQGEASSLHCFSAGSAWIQQVCDSQLKLQPHFVQDSSDFIARIYKLDVHETDLILHMDLIDLYMTGSPHELSKAVSNVVPSSLRKE